MRPAKAKPAPVTRTSLPMAGLMPGRKPVLTKQISTPILTKSLSATKPPPILRPTSLYHFPASKAVQSSISVRFRSCTYVFRPRPEEYYGLVEHLKEVAVFTGEPVMSYSDRSGKLRYLTDYHEMQRAYREYADQLIVDLRFD